jgi:glycosyltransferase involved in cell wall biosynthesis
MQAGAMELPSIVSNINGCNEIIENGINGLIVPPKDREALYDAMYKVVNDNDFRKILIKDTRKLIVERYEQHIVWKTIKDQYDLLLK